MLHDKLGIAHPHHQQPAHATARRSFRARTTLRPLHQRYQLLIAKIAGRVCRLSLFPFDFCSSYCFSGALCSPVCAPNLFPIGDGRLLCSEAGRWELKGFFDCTEHCKSIYVRLSGHVLTFRFFFLPQRPGSKLKKISTFSTRPPSTSPATGRMQR